jgi:putative permease
MTQIISHHILRRTNFWKLVGILALIALQILLVLTVENLLGSAVLAFVISYNVGPAVNYLERQGVSRALASLIVFLILGLVLAIFGYWFFPYLGHTLWGLREDMPRLIAGLSQFVSEIETRLHSVAGPLSDYSLNSKMEERLTILTHDFFEKLPMYAKTFLTVMLLGPFLAFFMVKDGRTLVRLVLGLVPNNLFEVALNMQHQINFQMGQFVRARIVESVIVGVLTALGLSAMHLPYAVLLGVLAGITNLIPYLGPIIGAIPAFLIAFVNGMSSLDFALLALIYVVVQLIDAGILIPLLVAKIVDLHPVTVIVVIIAGAQLMGIIGMIISIPVASALKVTSSTIYRHLIDIRR